MKSIYCFKDTSQVSKKSSYSFELPVYPASTTDPTYYEPTATRITNMRKSASSMKTLYDFEGDEASQFIAKNKDDEARVLKKLPKSRVDPRFNSNLTREEISQVANDLGADVQNMVDDKKAKQKKELDNIKEALTINKVIENTTQKSDTIEE